MYNDKTTRRQRLNTQMDYTFIQAFFIGVVLTSIIIALLWYAPPTVVEVPQGQTNYCARLFAAEELHPAEFYWEQTEWDSCVELLK